MNSDVLQALRYSLQKRVRRLNSAGSERVYTMTLRQYWDFLQNTPLIWGVLEDLRLRWPDIDDRVSSLLSGEGSFDPRTEEEQAAIALRLIEHCAESEKDSPVYTVSYRLGHVRSSHLSDYAQQFHELLTEPLYEYVDEQLDTGRAVLGLLIRYKHRCEWFKRDALFEAWSGETQKGEKILALDLYEFLFSQGVEFSIEPTSASGEADLVESQTGDRRLIADAKIFDPASGKNASYLAKGVHQLYIYTQDFNQPIGYLVVFKTSKADLRFALSEVVSGVPVLSHNNKSLFIFVVDIYPYPTPASKRGMLKFVEITEEDLLAVDDEASGS